jgi:hypothetical protein
MSSGAFALDAPALPFMILSHHRSGSNFLTDLMQANERVECISEPLSMHTDFRRFDLETWTDREVVPSYLHPRLHGLPGTAAFIRRLGDWLYGSPPSMVRGMKETLLFDKLSWCREIFPSSRVIWLVRDPRAVVHSVLRCGLWRFWEYPERVARFCRDYYRDQSINPVSPVELTLWSWKVRYALAREQLGHFDHLRVRLEDLVDRPQVELGRISELVGLPVTPGQEACCSRPGEESRGGTFSTVRRGNEVVGGWRAGLSDEDRMYVERLAGEEMMSLGYE